MIGNVFKAIAGSAKKLFSNWPSLIILIVLYAAMLASTYLFAATGLATVTQILLTMLVAVLAPLLFFVVQAMCVGYVDTDRSRLLLLSSLKGFWKLVLMTIPFALLAWLAVWLIAKIPVEPQAAAATVQRIVPARPGLKPLVATSTNWKAVGVAALHLVVLAFILPLAMVNMWIATNRVGVKGALKNLLKTLAHSFAPGSVLTYVVGFIVFAVIPYVLVFTKTPANGPWVDMGLLAARLIAAALLIIVGWAITLGALAERQVSQADPPKPMTNVG